MYLLVYKRAPGNLCSDSEMLDAVTFYMRSYRPLQSGETKVKWKKLDNCLSDLRIEDTVITGTCKCELLSSLRESISIGTGITLHTSMTRVKCEKLKTLKLIQISITMFFEKSINYIDVSCCLK